MSDINMARVVTIATDVIFGRSMLIWVANLLISLENYNTNEKPKLLLPEAFATLGGRPTAINLPLL